MRSAIVAVAVAVSGLAALPDRAVAQTDRADYVSDASFIVGTHVPASRDHTPEAMAAAANAFLALLDDGQKKRTVYALDDHERRAWTNLPARPNAGGIALGACNADQVRAACNLMATLLSETGYAKVRDIMLADDQLLTDGRPRPGFGTETFSIVLFGTPAPNALWAFQIDGHHLGLNVAIRGNDVTMSPSFIGAQPVAFTLGDRQVRPLAGELDAAYALVGSLRDAQRDEAVIGTRRGQIRTGPGRDGDVPEPRGVSCATLDEAQERHLLVLIAHWVGNLPREHAMRRMTQLVNEIDRMHFAWSGATSPGSDMSFIIQGPSLIIEYAGQDLGGDPLDHLHTMYRDPTNEYGAGWNETP